MSDDYNIFGDSNLNNSVVTANRKRTFHDNIDLFLQKLNAAFQELFFWWKYLWISTKFDTDVVRYMNNA